MAVRKVSARQSTKQEKSDQQPNQPKAPAIPGDYYLDREQLDAILHLVLAAQGISREFENQDELLGVADLFHGFSCGLSSIREKIEGQRIEKGGVQ